MKSVKLHFLSYTFVLGSLEFYTDEMQSYLCLSEIMLMQSIFCLAFSTYHQDKFCLFSMAVAAGVAVV
jgi:hypothetical protein